MNKKFLQRLYFFTRSLSRRWLTIITVSFIFLTISSCNKFDEPEPIGPDLTGGGGQGPVITSVTPGGTAQAGVRVITIEGQNFLKADTLWIYVGSNQSPIIKSITDTKIELYRPPNSGSSLELKIVDPMAIDSVAKWRNYNIEAPIDSIQSFLIGSGLPNYSVMEIDKNGTFWTSSNRRIDTVSADGLFFDIFKDRNRGLPSAFGSVTDLKFGRGGFLYALVGRADIYQISTAVADSSKPPLVYATIQGGTASKFDFDQQGNIYVGGNGGLYTVTPLTDSTGTAVSSGQYTGLTFAEVRVFNNHVYVADSKNVWRSSINGNTVGSPEQIVNLNSLTGFDTLSITSFNLDIDGRIYLCLQNHPQYSLFVLEDDGSVTPFYVDNIIPSNVRQILWGYNSKYLYLSRGGLNSGIRLFYLGMEKIGAPNYGRN